MMSKIKVGKKLNPNQLELKFPDNTTITERIIDQQHNENIICIETFKERKRKDLIKYIIKNERAY